MIAARDGDERDDVVEAHDDIGNDNDPDRTPQMCDGLDFRSVGIFGHEQLGRDEQKRRAADQFEVGQQHQRCDDSGESNTQQDRDAGADRPGPIAADAAAGRGRPSQ